MFKYTSASSVVSWRYLSFIQLPLAQRKFCQSCQQLLLPADWREHGTHQLSADISVAQLGRPSQLLYPLENKKTHAQYLFADRSCQFLAGLLATLGFSRVLCVGAPRYGPLQKFSPLYPSTLTRIFMKQSCCVQSEAWGSWHKRTWKPCPPQMVAFWSEVESFILDFSLKFCP